jgi:hypothetical protein
VFPTGGTRVLAYPAAHYAVADGKADYAFVYLNMRMAAGRSEAVKKKAGDACWPMCARTSRRSSTSATGRHHAADRREPGPGVRRQAQQPASPVQQVLRRSEPMLPRTTIANWPPNCTRARSRACRSSTSPSAFPDDVEDGYAISRAWVAHKIAEGRTVKGHKIGLTSRAMQQSSQIDEPDYGTLLDDMFFEQGGDIPFTRFIAPRVEVELAFILGKRKLQGPNVTSSTCWPPPTTWCRPSRSSMRASSSSTATPRRRARCSTPSATTRPTPASCWAAGR